MGYFFKWAGLTLGIFIVIAVATPKLMQPFATPQSTMLVIGGAILIGIVAAIKKPGSTEYWCIGCEKKIDNQGRCECNPQGRPDWQP